MQIHEHYAKTHHKIEKLYHAAHHISLVTNDLVGAGAAGRAGRGSKYGSGKICRVLTAALGIHTQCSGFHTSKTYCTLLIRYYY